MVGRIMHTTQRNNASMINTMTTKSLFNQRVAVFWADAFLLPHGTTSSSETHTKDTPKKNNPSMKVTNTNTDHLKPSEGEEKRRVPRTSLLTSKKNAGEVWNVRDSKEVQDEAEELRVWVAEICRIISHHDYLSWDHKVPMFKLKPIVVTKVLENIQSSPSLALQFFRWAGQKHGFYHSTYSYRAILDSLATAKMFKEASPLARQLVLLHNSPGEIFDLFSICRSTPVIFDMLIKAYAQPEMISHSTEAFYRMINLGFLPNIYSCSSLLNALLKSNLTDTVWKVYDDMTHSGITPNVYIFAILIEAACRGGQMQRAHDILGEMEVQGHSADTFIYNILIDGYCKNNMVKQALRLFQTLLQKAIEPDVVTYNTLIHALCRVGWTQEAKEYFEEMLLEEIKNCLYML